MIELESISFNNSGLIKYNGGKMLGNFLALSHKLIELNLSKANINPS